jgi:hypothetical protein
MKKHTHTTKCYAQLVIPCVNNAMWGDPGKTRQGSKRINRKVYWNIAADPNNAGRMLPEAVGVGPLMCTKLMP